jgi:hypothetical protein
VKAHDLRSLIVVSDDNLVPTEELTLAQVPPPNADREQLEQFCLTVDGYQGGRFTPDDLLAEADRVERNGLEHASLDDLRIAAFVRQRELRWSSMDSGHFDEKLVRSIRSLVDEIRRRIEESAQLGS